MVEASATAWRLSSCGAVSWDMGLVRPNLTPRHVRQCVTESAEKAGWCVAANQRGLAVPDGDAKELLRSHVPNVAGDHDGNENQAFELEDH